MPNFVNMLKPSCAISRRLDLSPCRRSRTLLAREYAADFLVSFDLIGRERANACRSQRRPTCSHSRRLGERSRYRMHVCAQARHAGDGGTQCALVAPVQSSNCTEEALWAPTPDAFERHHSRSRAIFAQLNEFVLAARSAQCLSGAQSIGMHRRPSRHGEHVASLVRLTLECDEKCASENLSECAARCPNCQHKVGASERAGAQAIHASVFHAFAARPDSRARINGAICSACAPTPRRQCKLIRAAIAR